jgi:hypothetical protein
MRKNILLVLCFNSCVLTICTAQIGNKIHEFKVTDVANVAIDRLGEFYIIFANQSIKKYNTDGKYLSTFKSKPGDSTTSIHPWNPLHVLLYDRNKKTIQFLDRSLSVLRKVIIDPSFAIEPSLACASSNNNNYWLYDKADFTIKKIDLSKEIITYEIDVKKVYSNKIPSLSYIREYQNSLFLLDKNEGVKIVSITGRLIDSIDSNTIANLSFTGEELYYLDKGKIHFYDLYTKQIREIEVGNDVQFALITDERIILVKSKKVSIYIFKVI